jgi:hypothetical protein
MERQAAAHSCAVDDAEVMGEHQVRCKVLTKNSIFKNQHFHCKNSMV